MDLDWEEGVFRGLLSLGRRLAPAREPVPSAVQLADHHTALTTLARLVAAEPVRILPARGVGGVRGADLLLPADCALAPDQASNRALFRLRTVVSAAMRRISREAPPALVAGAEELTSLRLARAAVDWLSRELSTLR